MMKHNLKGLESKIFFMLDEIGTQTAEQMALTLGVRKRRITKTIEQLRLKEIPICSSSKEPGYWIAKNRKEWKAFKWHQITSRLIALVNLSAAADATLISWEWGR